MVSPLTPRPQPKGTLNQCAYYSHMFGLKAHRRHQNHAAATAAYAHVTGRAVYVGAVTTSQQSATCTHQPASLPAVASESAIAVAGCRQRPQMQCPAAKPKSPSLNNVPPLVALSGIPMMPNYHQAWRNFEMKRTAAIVACPECRGSGMIVFTLRPKSPLSNVAMVAVQPERCPNCRGRGHVERTKRKAKALVS